MNTESDTEECKPLIEACTLELYQRNIFRITGLPVDATPKEVARQAQKLQMMDEMSGGGTLQSQAAFPLIPPPTTEQIREGLARMKEPEHRLVDEFFWYWPETFGDSKNDPAIQALLAGKAQEAMDLWLERERTGRSLVAKHNLAIMFHMFALDWTNHYDAHDLDEGRDRKIKQYWAFAFERWEILADADEIWDTIKGRVRSLADEALTTGFVRRMRQLLPQGLDRVNAEAALKFAELGQVDWAEYHVDYMRESNQGLDDVDSTVELVLGPTRKRVEQRLQAAIDQACGNPAKGAQVAAALMESCKPLMAVFDLFHGAESHHRAELFDEVASAVTDALVSYQKETGDDQAFVDLLKQAQTFATGTQIRDRLTLNIGIGVGNLLAEELKPFFKSLNLITDSSTRPAFKLQQLREQIMPKLPAMATRLGPTSPSYNEVLDAVAIALRGISIEAHNDHQDFATAESALQIALKLAITQDLKRMINKDVKVLSSNKVGSLCYFCGVNPSGKDAVFELAMYGNLKRGFNGLNYSKISVPIARCAECKGKGSKATGNWFAVWIVCIAVGGLIGGAQDGFRSVDGVAKGSFLGVCGLVAWITNWITKHMWQSDHAVQNDHAMEKPEDHPEVKKMLLKGWLIGSSP
jgi:hypothetical protein